MKRGHEGESCERARNKDGRRERARDRFPKGVMEGEGQLAS